jgi:gliding motility-associated-like protein
VTFEWFRSDTININFQPLGEGQDLTVTKSGLYRVAGTVGFCNAQSLAQRVIFFPKDTVWVPNVFTPNGDDSNPTFKVSTNAKNYSLEIINRWGEGVYSGTKESLPWDGGTNPSGVYFWNLDFRDCRDEKKSAKGWVQIVK